MRRVPHPLVPHLADRPHGLRGAIPDCAKRLEQTQDARHVGHQGLPGPWRGLPPVGMHGCRGIIRGDRLGVLGQDTRGCCHVGLSSRWGNRCPEQTRLSGCGGAITPRACQPTMLFVSHQVCGEPIRSFDRGPPHCTVPILGPIDTTTAGRVRRPRPWPHRAHAIASSTRRRRRRGYARSSKASQRRAPRERPYSLAPDASVDSPGAVCSRARESRRRPSPMETRRETRRERPRRTLQAASWQRLDG
jgi:hypothetical protein